jgi:hypothetical protein
MPSSVQLFARQNVSGGDLLGALTALCDAGARCVVVGAGGINFYLPDNEPPLATVDLDILLAPDVSTVRRVLAILRARGFHFEVGAEPFVDLGDDLVLERLIAAGTVVRGHSGEAYLDLMLSMPGARFGEVERDAVEFEVGGSTVKVGKLERLLAAKERAGRPKDLEFLRAFAARFPPSRKAARKRRAKRRKPAKKRRR